MVDRKSKNQIDLQEQDGYLEKFYYTVYRSTGEAEFLRTINSLCSTPEF